MQIGDIKINKITRLAPMASISNIPFRLIALECGSGMITSEEIDSAALVSGNVRTNYDIASYLPEEKPIALQLLGATDKTLVPAAIILEDRGADIIDINMGCPMRKITKTGRGAAMMKDIVKTSKILRSIRSAIKIPLTIKIRGGWNDQNLNAPDFARMAELEGVDAITVHPRSRTQKFTGYAPWDVIGKVVDSVSIPVTGNGDVLSMNDAKKMKDQTGCHSVMIGRAAIGNPWIFSEDFEKLSSNDKYDYKNKIIRKHMSLIREYFRDSAALLQTKKHLCWYAGSNRMVRPFRKKLFNAKSISEAEDIFENFWTNIITNGRDYRYKKILLGIN
mgnify:CR=1 FL=1